MVFRFGVLISLLWAIQTQARPLCTFGETFLKPGKNNVCLQKLNVKAKSKEDRVLLRKMISRWNPPKDLLVQLVSGGFMAFRGSQKIAHAVWIQKKPLTLYWNGSIRMIPQPMKSVKKTVDALLNQKVSWLEVLHLLPEAQAQNSNEQLGKDLLVYFMFKDMDSGDDAAGAVKALPENEDRPYFPNQTAWEKWVKGSTVQCTEKGVQNLVYKLPDGKSLSLTAMGRGEFIATGLVPGKKVRINYAPSQVGAPCLLAFKEKIDQKYCQPAWQRLFAQEPSMQKEYMEGNASYLSCSSFSEENKRKCEDFWREAGKQFVTFQDAHLDMSHQRGNAEMFLCEDEDCKVQRKLDQVDEFQKLITTDKEIADRKEYFEKQKQESRAALVEYLKKAGVKGADQACRKQECTFPAATSMLKLEQISEAKDLLARANGEFDPNRSLKGFNFTQNISHAVQGATVLSECCKSDSCRKSVWKSRSLRLESGKATR
ncbi:MAG: hypothetical protein CL676_12210 [Bdellovibrionaceae bacterium]|nr:hypothetical protein [Pseudobdellovibrionaceae bacterium]